MRIYGIDFSSSPTRKKPIVVAHAVLQNTTLHLQSFERLESLEAFGAWLDHEGPWIGGFDFPFALPRELLHSLGWAPFDHLTLSQVDSGLRESSLWSCHIRSVAKLSRAEMVAAFKGFCDARPVGAKFAHRACDGPAGSSPSMKWVNPPVSFMLHAGAPRLLASGVHIPGLHGGFVQKRGPKGGPKGAQNDGQRVALEAYPGYLARQILGRTSYKSDDAKKQNQARRTAREALMLGLNAFRGLSLRCDAGLRELCIADASGDHLDAWLCAVLAASGYAEQRNDPATNFGMGDIDPLEGWMVGVPRL